MADKFCTYCGKPMPEGAKFCFSCGKNAVTPSPIPEEETPEAAAAPISEPISEPIPAPAPTPVAEAFPVAVPFASGSAAPAASAEKLPVSGESTGWRIILGILFLLVGLVQLFAPTLAGMLFTMENIYEMGTTYVAAAVAAANLFNSMDGFVLPLVGMLSLVTGITMLQKRPGSYRAAMISGVFQILAAVYVLIMLFISFACPQILFQLLTPSPELINMATLIMRKEIGMMLRYILIGLPILFMSVLCFVFVILARKKQKKLDPKSRLFGKMARSTASMMILMPALQIFQSMKQIIDLNCMSMYGSTAFAAHSIADTVVKQKVLSITVLLLFMLVYCMLGRKWKYWILTLPVFSLLFIYGAVLVVQVFTTMPSAVLENNIPADLISMVIRSLFPMVLEYMILALTYFFWIASTARGSIPIWLQLILGLPLGIVYACLSYVKVCVLQMGVAAPPVDILILAAIILIITVLMGFFCKPKKGKEEWPKASANAEWIEPAENIYSV